MGRGPMGKISAVYFPRLRVTAPLLIAAALVVTACQGGESKGENSASQSSAKKSCENALSAQGKQAVRRVSGIPASREISFYGAPQETADELAAQHDSGTADVFDEIPFCRIHEGSSVVIPEVEVEFSLAQDIPEPSKDTIVKEYRMGKSASAGAKVGILYFECSSKKFSLGAGATVLVMGVARVSGEVTEPEGMARRDNLRIIYESSRALSKLLDCKSNAGLPASFTMPPEL